jgi:hypothetical protein
MVRFAVILHNLLGGHIYDYVCSANNKEITPVDPVTCIQSIGGEDARSGSTAKNAMGGHRGRFTATERTRTTAQGK